MNEQTVVLVDDNDAFRKSTTWLLKTAGFSVDEFDNAAGALHALKHQRRGGGTCLLSDVRMPQMSGLQLHEEIRKAAIDVPVVLMTGHGDIPLAVDAMRNGALDFVEKPFSEQRIVNAVRGAFAAHSAARVDVDATERIESLTPRERQVLDLVVAGKSNKVIAGLLDISIKTVELHRANMMTKMKVRTVPDLMKLVLGHHDK